jgi:hypothetical protein
MVRSPAVDAQIGFQQPRKWLVAFNINVKWNDIEYYYVSRLKDEGSALPGYVVHAGVPRTLRAHFTYYF